MFGVHRLYLGSFNSRLREEATSCPTNSIAIPCGFNSRLREEATSSSIPAVASSESFNSRLREEATGGLYSN